MPTTEPILFSDLGRVLRCTLCDRNFHRKRGPGRDAKHCAACKPEARRARLRRAQAAFRARQKAKGRSQ